MSLLAFSFVFPGPIISSISCIISGRLLLLPPRLKLDDVEEELRPESGTGEAWHSRRKSNPPVNHTRKVCHHKFVPVVYSWALM